MAPRNVRHAIPASLLMLLMVAPAAPANAAGRAVQNRDVDGAVSAMRRAAAAPLRIERSPATGLVRSLSAPGGKGVPVRSAGNAEERALAFIGDFGPAIGLDRRSARVTRVSTSGELGLEHVRLQQESGGVPVAGGEAILHLRDGAVVALLAKTVPDLDRVATVPALGPEVASRAARDLVVKHLGIADAELSAPRLEILNPALLDGGRWRPSRLAWFVEARTFDRLEYVWVDAGSGSVLLNFNQLPTARNRLVYDAQDTAVFEKVLARSEGDPAVGDPDTDHAYDYSGDTYDYYWNEHGRDSYDDAGAALKSTVHFCPSAGECPYVNAFWNGSRMVYGEGFASADDVVAHELTHAVTSYTARLYYYMQSGALNEAFSDIFGETVDLLNGGDAPEDRWLMGEDLPMGAIRDMLDPNNGWQPATMSDELFFDCGSPGTDNGGVHTNSGVPNRAYSLMVDGGTFNGQTVTAIGLAKAGKIQYRVLTEYLISSSDFADYHDAVNQACTDLVGSAGITAGDCAEVAKALQAVELGDPWPCLPQQSSEPDLCAPGSAPEDLFFDDIDTSPGDGWTVYTSNPDDDNCRWFLGGFASSGSLSLWAPDISGVCTVDVRMDSSISIPGTGSALRFNHAFGFEDGSGVFYDGGLIIVSTDDGSSWSPADCSSCGGLGYGGSIAEGFGNEMAGEAAFVADSYGYTVSQLDLSPYAGQSVRLGFRVGTDESIGDRGWWLDDIRIFQCVATQTEDIFADDFESSDPSAWSSAVGAQ